ncbi:MAG TPA: fused MFS/spermidine synthase [Solirubrobacteraceae bacterium]|nr:fused MFS/spermidine synthase [Solirubrobacteraceae bacterium]
MPAKSPARRAQPTKDVQPAVVAASLPPVLAAGLVFVASGVVLVLEILSVRLLTPYVGMTLETTTSIIGAVLAGIAAGAALGGWIADRANPRRLAVGLLTVGGLFVLLTVPIIRALGPLARDGGNLAAAGVTFAALAPVAAILSAVTPTVARLQLRDLQASGTVVGRLSAWATAGALVGTFGTGFVLVPLLPVSSSVLAIGILLVLAGVLLGAYTQMFNTSKLLAPVVGLLALGPVTPLLHSPCDVESTYHCVRVATDPARSTARLLVLDQDYNSYVDLKDPTLLVFPYTRWIGDAINAIGRPKAPLNGVFIGGGGFTLPRWLLATRPGSHAQVLEVDRVLVDVDRDRLGLRTSPQMRSTIGDARVSLHGVPTGSADVVVGDAFSGLTVPWQLMTIEWLRDVKRVLRPEGLYALNTIDAPPLGLLRAEAATLLASFTNVRLITHTGADRRPVQDNEVMLASDGPLPPERSPAAFGATTFDRQAVVQLVAGAESLRDDYAPVDQLQTR